MKTQLGRNAKMEKIKYVSNHDGTIYTSGYTEEDVRKSVKENWKIIFFNKSNDWKYEKEIRIIQANRLNKDKLFIGDSLLAAILCLPKIENHSDYKESPEFKIMKAILPNKPILRYTTRLGNKELLDENGEKVCVTIGQDSKNAFSPFLQK